MRTEHVDAFCPHCKGDGCDECNGGRTFLAYERTQIQIANQIHLEALADLVERIKAAIREALSMIGPRTPSAKEKCAAIERAALEVREELEDDER
jgi:hypothetical protein